jgi:hypothetical protein
VYLVSLPSDVEVLLRDKFKPRAHTSRRLTYDQTCIEYIVRSLGLSTSRALTSVKRPFHELTTAATINASSQPGVRTIPNRVYNRRATVKVDSTKSAVVTPNIRAVMSMSEGSRRDEATASSTALSLQLIRVAAAPYS